MIKTALLMCTKKIYFPIEEMFIERGRIQSTGKPKFCKIKDLNNNETVCRIWI